MKILVLGGGNSPEREVSIRSARAVANAARQAGFEVEEADPAESFSILDNLAKNTIVLPILHGENGEDGIVQAEMEKRGLAFLGSDSRSSKNCFDKWQTRLMLEKANILMPDAAEVTSETYKNHLLSKQPHVLKVINGGSSIGTLIVRNPGGVKPEQVAEVFDMENRAVLEKLIEGIEITVPILDHSSLPVIEIVPPQSLEFDYENKYNGATQEIVPPKSISAKIQKQAQKLTEQIHQIMGCRHLSRTDFMVDTNGKLFTLEINTMPGLTDQSLYPKAAAVAGLSMLELVQRFVDLVKRDFKVE